jgi:hypothetical protein
MKLNKLIVIATALSMAILSSHILLKQQADVQQIPAEVIVAYSKWKSQHGRLYASPSEDNYRLKVFSESYQMVKETNSQNGSYQLGLNKFAATSWEEFKIILGGTDTTIEEIDQMKKEARLNSPKQDEDKELEQKTQSHPDKLDWRAKSRSPKSVDHDDCPNTTALVAAMQMSAKIAIKEGFFPRAYSYQQMIDCVATSSDRCKVEKNSSYKDMMVYLRSSGITEKFYYGDESFSPYYADCRTEKIKKPIKVSRWTNGDGDESDFYMEKFLLDGPVAINMYSCPKLKLYKSGIFDYDCSNDSDKVYLTQMISGYDRNEGWWKVTTHLGSFFGDWGDILIKKVNGQRSRGYSYVLNWPMTVNL